MAGYMTKLQGYVFEGEYKLAEGEDALHNGGFAKLAANEGEGDAFVVKGDDGSSLTLTDLGECFIYDGVPVHKYIVLKNDDNIFFVENGMETAKELAYNNVEYAIKPGEYVRMHMLLPGDEFVTDALASDSEADPGNP